MLALVLLFAAFGLAPDRYGGQPAPYLFVQINAYSRYVCVALMLVAAALYGKLGFAPRFAYFGGAGAVIWIFQIYIMVKMLVLGGDIAFFLLALILIAAQVAVFVLSAGRSVYYLAVSGQKDVGIEAMALAKFAVLFSIANLFAYIFFAESVMTYHGRLYGVMANPQHLMMVCVLCLPACIFVMRRARLSLHQILVLAAVIICLAYFVYQSGSRSGAVAIGIILAIGFRDLVIGRWLLPAILATLIIGLAIGSFVYDFAFSTISERFVEGREDTRSWVWEREWREFIENPDFGVGLNEEGRFLFSETLWLSAASNGGILGVILIFPVFVWLLRYSLVAIYQCVARPSDHRWTMIATSLLSILSLSFFESILGGLMTAYTMMSVLYLSLANQIIRADGNLLRRRALSPPSYTRPSKELTGR